MLLANVYVEHGEALEYDLFHLWGQDINHPLMTIRRLRNFFLRLPIDSETLNDIAEVSREARAWNVNTWMLANILDAVAHLDWVTIASNSRNTPRPPKPFDRPAMKKIVKSKKAMWPGKTIVDRGEAGI
jgi:hypothetical protein